MTWWAILILGAVLVAALAAIASTIASTRRPVVARYAAQSFLFSPAERSFLGALDLAVGGRYRVFGKVRVADVVAVSQATDSRQRQGAFNRISAKHFDFVLCSTDETRVVGVIELDDRSHQAPRRRHRDAFLEEVCRSISLPLIRVRAQRTYSTESLRSALAVCSASGIHAVSDPTTRAGNAASDEFRHSVASPQVIAPVDNNPQRCEPTMS